MKIEMPMITLHWDATGWFEIHHGALRKLLPAWCQETGGRADVNYSPRLSAEQALKTARAANPGVDVQLITTVIARNEATMFWSGKRDRRSGAISASN